MESKTGVPVSEGNDFHIQGSYIPSTPVKPERTVRVHWITTGEIGNQGSTTAGQADNNVGIANKVHDLCNPEAAKTQIYRLGSYTQDASWGNNVPLVHLVACTDEAVATAMQRGSHSEGTFSSIMHAQINNGIRQQQPNSTNFLMPMEMTQNILLQLPQNEFPLPYIHSNVVPETPLQHRSKNALINQASSQKKDSTFISSPLISTPVQENETNNKQENNLLNEEIDLNKTPQQRQKIKRRKHRPKVIREVKPNKTPKPVTPKPKRKYTRNTGPKVSGISTPDLRENTGLSGISIPDLREHIDPPIESVATPSADFEELPKYTIMTPVQQDRSKVSATPLPDLREPTLSPDLRDHLDKEADRKSCRRSLNFDLEVQPTRSPDLRDNLGRESGMTNQTENTISPKGSVVDHTRTCSRGLDELDMVVKSPGLAFDLNCCLTEFLANYISLPEESNPENSNPSSSLVRKENLKSVARNKNAEIYLNRGDNMSVLLDKNIQTRKRTLSHGSKNNINMHFPEICKKKRTAISGNGTRRASSSNQFILRTIDGSNSPLDLEENQHVGYTNTVDVERNKNISEESFSSIKGQTERLNRKKLLDSVLGLRIERRTKKKWNGSFHARALPAMAIANENERNTPRKVYLCESRQSTNALQGPQPHGPQPCVEALVAYNNAKLKTKKRTKKERASHPPNSISMSYPYMQLMRQHDTSESKDLMEEVIQKLICLSINGDRKSDSVGALVPYNGYRTLVPYKGAFDFVKKRKPRAKVDLDPETNRVWKLLMWKEPNDGTEAEDTESEKRWEEQRTVFRGRAELFIARMRLVQGDRRFSRWKGSVVDSVVGVFLTQNVSDHLSSSAYMALAARFPLQSQNCSEGSNVEGTITTTEEAEVCIIDSRSEQNLREVEICNESFESTMVGSTTTYLKGEKLPDHEMSRESLVNRTGTLAEDRKVLEDVSPAASEVSSQISTESTVRTIHTVDRIGSSVESNYEADFSIEYPAFSSFTELLQSQIVRSNKLQEFIHDDERNILKDVPDQSEVKTEGLEFENKNSSFKGISVLNGSCSSIYESATHYPQAMHGIQETHAISCSGYHLHSSQGSSATMEIESMEASGEEIRCCLPPNSSEMAEVNDTYSTEKRIGYGVENVKKDMVQQNLLYSDEIATEGDSYANKSNLIIHASSGSKVGTYHENNSIICENPLSQKTRASLGNDTFCACSESHVGQTIDIIEKPRLGDMEVEIPENAATGNVVEELDQRQSYRTQQIDSNLPKHVGGDLDVDESLSLIDKQQSVETTAVESNSREGVCGPKNLSTESTDNTSHAKKARRSAEKKKVFDWDSLRKQACCAGFNKERSSDRMDSLDWEAVLCAEVHEIANTIRERGMNNMLAERIKDFLNRIVKDHGSIDLEWLRDVPPEKAKDYLLSIRGLGLKSVECVRLLTLHHLAFPVDTNVGRICVRLGWVPLQPLPESLHLHLLEMYPMQENIQKYLWPRLCTLDQGTLYELHYQMITFGKVFCTKSKPNCNACPMRAECRHFASAFASARLALPGPEEKSIVSSAVSMTAEEHSKLITDPLPLPPMEDHPDPQARSEITRCEPIIEEPASPEQECAEGSQNEIQASEKDIEDAFWEEDPDEIPTIKLNIEEFTINVQNYMQQNNIELQDGDMSKALVAFTPEAASIPMPKLKNVSRLRTEHQVYELPDSHPLLEKLDRREPDDPCSYLLAIWTPGETSKSTQPPEICCNSQESGNLCDKETCFACSSVREEKAQTVRGTLLIPCRTAMRGSFPLNGTYFQVNEVFADHDSSLAPIPVPRALIWNLPRRTVYFGTSIPSIFKGLTTEGIQHCFWRGFVCVRGFDQKTRAPRPLIARLHFPATKLVRTRKKPTNLE